MAFEFTSMEEVFRTIAGDHIDRGLYPHPTEDLGAALLYREQYLRKFSASIREETDWVEKITDRSFIVNKLREAAAVDGVNSISGKPVYVWDKEDIDFVYQELIRKYKPYVEECKGVGIQPGIDGVWRIDGFADEKLRGDLIKAAATLENGPCKMWHPESNQQLLDLVHPSMWPIIYGRTRTISGEVVQAPEIPEHYSFPQAGYSYSEKFCWLPSEFEISREGKTRIASYINNLALPEQAQIFYPILEEIFSKFVPIFNHVLADLRREIQTLRRVERLSHKEIKKFGYKKSIPEEASTNTLTKLLTQFEKGETLTADVSHEVQLSHTILKRLTISNLFHNHKPMKIVSRGKLTESTWEPPARNVLEHVKLEGSTARVIVKMATIILTPEKPKWSGSRWHVEALKNERIVATGIYYYDQENITPSALGFRRAMGPIRLRSDNDLELSEMYNTQVDEGNPISQEIGKIATKQNRAIVFPNIFQHRVEPFELEDKTKNGYRRILAFFLCDPSREHKIPTTKTIPPQQPDVQDSIVQTLCKTGAGRLPVELFQLIIKDLPPAISRGEAARYKKEMMDERTKSCEDSQAFTNWRAERDMRIQRLLQYSD
ncbi:hypothetical protein TWF718_009731 [Orbilia javanica]|uniref:DUF4246 domain-containing protein n=1 Tax=Orbilia javanica TaxID=47235 RepID=A0AAN8RBP1_9PEZI